MVEAHVWDEKLDVGHEALDREHHLQVALASAFVDAIEQGRPRLATRLADQLASYTGAHFTGEELLMEAAAYADLGSHVAEHERLVRQVEGIRAAIAAGETDLALSSALEFREALAGHMAASDRRFAERIGPERPDRG